MNITSFTASLTVRDVRASADFLTTHFGFVEQRAADGYASLVHAASGANIVYLQQGIEVLPEAVRDENARGVILALVTDNLEAHFARLRDAGIPIAMQLTTESWDEKLFIVQDPNGVLIELVEWVEGGADWNAESAQ